MGLFLTHIIMSPTRYIPIGGAMEAAPDWFFWLSFGCFVSIISIAVFLLVLAFKK